MAPGPRRGTDSSCQPSGVVVGPSAAPTTNTEARGPVDSHSARDDTAAGVRAHTIRGRRLEVRQHPAAKGAGPPQQVLWLDVTVQQPTGVGVGQAEQDLLQEGAHLEPWHLAGDRAGRAPAEQLEGDPRRPLDEAIEPRSGRLDASLVEDPDDVGVVQGRHRRHLRLEAPLAVAAAGLEQLHGGRVPRGHVVRQVDDPHAPSADGPTELEATHLGKVAHATPFHRRTRSTRRRMVSRTSGSSKT
jgi:hypothetical protein